MKPKFLYHGSGIKLKGDSLLPRKASDTKNRKGNSYKAVYASDIKREAIVMGISSCKGVHKISVHVKGNMVNAVISKGWPRQKYFYLYILPSRSFLEKPTKSHQWVSFKPVKPIKAEKIKVLDYIKLVKKVSK